jgi:hypothetical protein
LGKAISKSIKPLQGLDTPALIYEFHLLRIVSYGVNTLAGEVIPITGICEFIFLRPPFQFAPN